MDLSRNEDQLSLQKLLIVRAETCVSAFL